MRDRRIVEAKPFLGLAEMFADQVDELVDRDHHIGIE